MKNGQWLGNETKCTSKLVLNAIKTNKDANLDKDGPRMKKSGRAAVVVVRPHCLSAIRK